MNTAHDSAGAQAVYDLWLGLIPQFFGQFGVTMPERTARTQGSAPGSGPMSDWMAQWAAAVPGFAAMPGFAAAAPPFT